MDRYAPYVVSLLTHLCGGVGGTFLYAGSSNRSWCRKGWPSWTAHFVSSLFMLSSGTLHVNLTRMQTTSLRMHSRGRGSASGYSREWDENALGPRAPPNLFAASERRFSYVP